MSCSKTFIDLSSPSLVSMERLPVGRSVAASASAGGRAKDANILARARRSQTIGERDGPALATSGKIDDGPDRSRVGLRPDAPERQPYDPGGEWARQLVEATRQDPNLAGGRRSDQAVRGLLRHRRQEVRVLTEQFGGSDDRLAHVPAEPALQLGDHPPAERGPQEPRVIVGRVA